MNTATSDHPIPISGMNKSVFSPAHVQFKHHPRAVEAPPI